MILAASNNSLQVLSTTMTSVITIIYLGVQVAVVWLIQQLKDIIKKTGSFPLSVLWSWGISSVHSPTPLLTTNGCPQFQAVPDVKNVWDRVLGRDCPFLGIFKIIIINSSLKTSPRIFWKTFHQVSLASSGSHGSSRANHWQGVRLPWWSSGVDGMVEK